MRLDFPTKPEEFVGIREEREARARKADKLAHIRKRKG